MSKRSTYIITVVFVLLVAALTVAFVMLSQSRSDINNLQASLDSQGATAQSEYSQAKAKAEQLKTDVTKVDSQLSGDTTKLDERINASIKKAQKDAQIDAAKPFLTGDVSLNDLLDTVNQNAKTANSNFAKIELKVPSLSGKLDEESEAGQ